MRVALKTDGMTADGLRELCAALSLAHVGRNAVTVGCDGPEMFHAETVPMTSQQWATVAAMLVKVDGKTIEATLDAYRDDLDRCREELALVRSTDG